MKLDPRAELVDARLWIPDGLELAVLELVQGRLTDRELDDMQTLLEERLSMPTLIATGFSIEVRRY